MAQVVQEPPRARPHILMQMIGWRHGRSRRVVEVMKVPTVATEMRVIVLLKEFIFTGREVVQRLLLEDSSGFSAFIQESPGFSS